MLALQAAVACKFDLSQWLGELNVDLDQVATLAFLYVCPRAISLKVHGMGGVLAEPVTLHYCSLQRPLRS